MSETDLSDDELLTAYLDGELSDEDRARVEAALADDADLQARLADLDIPLNTLRDAMDQVLNEAPHMPVLPARRTAPRAVPLAITGGALAAGVAIGALLMTSLTPAPKAPGWIDYVAAYQVLYSTETLEAIETDPEMQTAELETVSETVGRSLNAARSIPGLDFKRAQILGFKGKPLAQLAYLSEGGVPLALCVIASTNDADIKQMEREGLQAASWSDGQFAYLLIGGQDAALIEETARRLKDTL